MEWSFSYAGSLAGLTAALDVRENDKNGLAKDPEALIEFRRVRPLIEQQAAICASESDTRSNSKGVVTGANLDDEHASHQPVEGAAVRIHAFGSEGVVGTHQSQVHIDVTSYDLTVG